MIRSAALIWLSLVLFTFTGCLMKKEINGDAFVDKEVLIDILVDIHLSEGITNDRKFHRRFEADSVDLLNPILEKYGVTREMFDTTMYAYSRYPHLMDEVYNEVLIDLNIMLDQNDKEQDVSTPAR
jgi:hypothetical protein